MAYATLTVGGGNLPDRLTNTGGRYSTSVTSAGFRMGHGWNGAHADCNVNCSSTHDGQLYFSRRVLPRSDTLAILDQHESTLLLVNVDFNHPQRHVKWQMLLAVPHTAARRSVAPLTFWRR
jgi:hypothetical protein